ncbi:MAG: D-glycerate dehydrogenase [Thermoplasmata archaeon]|uniref:D-glycerate dehydrogenase n=1 Tax=Candidatus Sysuiplasma superficiale TaxID=2823368 RepID=A0A8J8CCP8_9ARCH|nr:D-glycerate dehydrogenase [Candidatus Sysuiplasma superficiale]MBX8643794.1 D-glycerate dehydrogenase [Candidatus Sysuiplasma superficiale]
MHRIISTANLPGKSFEELRKKHDVTVWNGNSPPGKEWIIKNIIDTDALITTLSSKIDAGIMDAAPNLRVIGTYSVGYDHIDVEHASGKGIRVVNTPDVLTDSTADLIFGLMIAVSRRMIEGDRLVRNGDWTQPWNPTFMCGHDVHGKTLGILGAGRIGRAVAMRARGFDMNVIYSSRRIHSDFPGSYVGLEELFSDADFLVITVDLNRETYRIVDRTKLRMMKNDAYIINASRGDVVDEQALEEALEAGWIAGAALDVFSNEPVGKDSRFGRFTNTVLTPHLGSSTVETRERMTDTVVGDVLSVLDGREPRHEVTGFARREGKY